MVGRAHAEETVNDDELRDEAEELLNRLDGSHITDMTPRDAAFVDSMLERFEQYGERTRVTRRQVFWLRDIAERVNA